MLTRRERIPRLERIASLAKRTAEDVASLPAVPMPPEARHQLRVMAEAAQVVASLVAKEIVFLESARDWTEGDER
jgi:hypothetical protein